MKAKIDEFETNGKIKNIRQMILTHWHTTFYNTWRTYKY